MMESQKRRGRPRKATNPTNPLEALRRERNRQAQHVFRLRKQTTKDQQIRQLQGTVEQICNTFLDFTGNLVESKEVRRNQQLMDKLQGSIERIVSLVADTAPIAIRPSSPAAAAEDAGVEVTPPREAPAQAASAASPPRALSIVNVFGNGWMAEPASFTSLLELDIEEVPRPSPFGLRLIHYTIFYTYYTVLELEEEMSEATKRLVQYTLAHHSREQMLHSMRWFLGPGTAEQYRLTGSAFPKTLPKYLQEEHIWSSLINVTALEDIQKRSSSIIPASTKHFWSVCDIDAFFQAKNARFLDEDRFVISINGTLKQQKALDGADNRLDAYFSEGMFSPTDRDAGSYTTEVKFSQAKLFRNLAEIAVCLAYGPAFQGHALEKTIAASVIE